jgi:hypothetical protein
MLVIAAMDGLLHDSTVQPLQLAQSAKLGVSVGNGADGMARLDRITRPLEAVLGVLESAGAVQQRNQRQQQQQQRAGGAGAAQTAGTYPAMQAVETWRLALIAVETVFRSLPPSPMDTCRAIHARLVGGGAPRAASRTTVRQRRSAKPHWTDVISTTSQFAVTYDDAQDGGALAAAGSSLRCVTPHPDKAGRYAFARSA